MVPSFSFIELLFVGVQSPIKITLIVGID